MPHLTGVASRLIFAKDEKAVIVAADLEAAKVVKQIGFVGVAAEQQVFRHIEVTASQHFFHLFQQYGTTVHYRVACIENRDAVVTQAVHQGTNQLQSKLDSEIAAPEWEVADAGIAGHGPIRRISGDTVERTFDIRKHVCLQGIDVASVVKNSVSTHQRNSSWINIRAGGLVGLGR